ncbi:MAG: prolipoprotein diacylglyceryl transferase [Polyangiaceae bacterium]
MPTFTWDIDPIFFKIGPLALRYYSLLFVFVFLGGYWLLKWQVERGGGDEEDAGDFIVYGVLGVLVGSRLGHVLFYDLDKALKDPLWVFRIWEGGLASHGAVLGLIFAMYLFTKRRRIPFLEGSDRFAFSAALGATLVRVGNFFNSEIVGRLTDQSWGVRFPRYDRGVPEAPLRYPSQLYEVALGLFVLLCLYLWDKRLGGEKRPRGAMISLFFALYFPGRFVIEFYKEHQTLEPTSFLTMGQYLSIPGALLGFYGLWWSFQRRLPVGWATPGARLHDEDDEDFDDDDDLDETDRLEDDVEDALAGDDDEDDEPVSKPPVKKGKKAKKKAKKSKGAGSAKKRAAKKPAPPPEDDDDDDDDDDDGASKPAAESTKDDTAKAKAKAPNAEDDDEDEDDDDDESKAPSSDDDDDDESKAPSSDDDDDEDDKSSS